MKLKPVGQRIIIEPKKEPEKTKSGLYIPESARENKKRGTVVAVGKDKHGKPLPIEKGQQIIYGGYSDEEIEIDDKEYIIIEFKDVMATIER